MSTDQLLDRRLAPSPASADADPREERLAGAASWKSAPRGFALWIIGPAIIFVAGLGVVAWDYALLPRPPLNYLWFWIGIGLCLLGVLLAGLRSGARDWEHILELGAFGAALYLPYFLRSPGRLIFTDELYHYQVVQLISESGHTHVPVTLYPIPGEFPGLELSTLSFMAATGLPIQVAARIIPLLAHMLIPVLAYLVARRVTGTPRSGLHGYPAGRLGFIAALVYMTNTSYYFFHSVFAYETLGVVLALSFWVLLAGFARRDAPPAGLALMLLVLFATTVTHHISSYLLALSIMIAWLTTRFVASRSHTAASGVIAAPRRNGTGLMALFSVLLAASWLTLDTQHAGAYLSRSILARIQSTLQILGSEQHSTRHLFWKSTLPALERLVDFAYAPLLLILAIAGLYLVVGKGRWRRVPALLIALAIFGPVMWLAAAPLILTPSSDAAYRIWPFIFIGMGIYCAYPILLAQSWVARRVGRPVGLVVTFVLLAVLFTGGISVGDNQAGRFPTVHPAKAAGPEDLTKDMVTAAQWLEHTTGRYHSIVGDGASQLAFATYGFQRAHTWGNWIPFLDRRPAQLTRYLRTSGTQYIIVDRRITQLLPRYQFYFGQSEIYAAHGPGYNFNRPFPAQLVAKFDRVSTLDRIYDNGNIRIYKAIK